MIGHPYPLTPLRAISSARARAPLSELWSRTWALGALLLISLLVIGCAGTQSVHQDPRSFRDRAERQTIVDFTVDAVALSNEESIEVFGASLNLVGIQPVWLSIDNKSKIPQWVFPIGVDENYFPAYEVTRRLLGLAELSEHELFEHLSRLHLRRLIPPGKTAQGFVYTHTDEGMKAFNVELHSARDVHDFHFVVPVPGLPTRYIDLDPARIHQPEELHPVDREGLRSWLEALACCPRDGNGQLGDPLNVVFIGSLNDVRRALVSARWDVTAPVDRASLWRMVSAFIFGSRYRYAPISPLYLFGRDHDLAFQKARAVIDERNHMRLWLAPVTFAGTPVWVGQVSRDVGVKFSWRFWPPTTHIIDPDVDDARFYVLQELIDDGSVIRVGFVKGHEPASATAPHRNAEGDEYFTDGLRAVFFLSSRPVKRSQVEFLDWRLPPDLVPSHADYLTSFDAAGRSLIRERALPYVRHQ